MSERLVFLVTDGRLLTIGHHRAADPSAVVAAVQAQGLRGWIAVMSGSAYARQMPELTCREAVGGREEEWAPALQAMRTRHLKAIGQR